MVRHALSPKVVVDLKEFREEHLELAQQTRDNVLAR